ncbi:MAG: hypothetical protein STSR0008_23540 [Ignavibacterium sp.]
MQLLEPPYSLTHGNATFTKLKDNQKWWFTGNPVLASGLYFVDMYKLSIDRNDLNYLETPKAWLPKGYYPNNPNNSEEFIYDSTTPTSVHAYAFFYYVRYDEVGHAINMWVPYNPSQQYTILEKPVIAIVNVTLTTAQFPEGVGSGGTYEVNGENVGSTFNGTIHSGQTIRAIPPSGSYFCQ